MIEQLFTTFLPVIIAALTLQPATPPNIIIIIADDLNYADTDFMPNVQALAASGASFESAYVSHPVCCPSRASILRGQYTHNHGVSVNNGGFQLFRDLGRESSTISTWLNDASYHTGFIGKYLNGFTDADVAHIPPGWDYFAESCKGHYYQKKSLCEQGTLTLYGKMYETTLLGDKAEEFITGATSPYFLYLAPYSVHEFQDNYPPCELQYCDLFAGMQAPRTVAFNEADRTDKAPWVQAYPALTQADIDWIDASYRARLRAAQSLDDLVGRVISATDESTYVIFVSDNGYSQGEHGLWSEKNFAYEENIHVPLIVAGPNIQAGMVITQLVSLIDLAPTIAELTSASIPAFVDGRSLVPLLNGTATTWRGGLLIERQPPGNNSPQNFVELRTACTALIMYTKVPTFTERYKMEIDPYQVTAFSGDGGLMDDLTALRTCTGQACRDIENAISDCISPQGKGRG